DDYNELLESMRSGELTKKHIDLLKERVLSNIAARGDAFEESQEELNESRLYTHNLNTAQYNAERLKMLDGEEKEFVMTGDGPESMVATLKRGCLAPEKLKLKIGAVVISLKNDPDCEYVNGSVGKVVDFDSKNNDPIVQFENGNKCIMEEAQWQITSIETGEELASIKQIPLTLAWGITIHKSQGMTLGKATIDLRKAFEPGMGYVALSRLRSFSDLTLLGFNDIAIRTSDKARELDKYFRERSQLLETLYGE
ncbi:MAG: ATP-dependent endonuclease, partial [Candidatus Ancillula sp.]|nr:ATP-dependent endonuclease [Candidatus Ancillula sp.]